MALRKIRLQGDEVLAKVSRPVEKMTPRIHDLIGDMLETMYDAMGVGLAAPQVGMLKRIVVIDIGEGPIVLINPEILETSGEQTGDEGCLSVPGMAGQVTRPNYVKVKALDEDMNEVEYEGEGLLARAFCHEIDHLDGHMYTELPAYVPQADNPEAYGNSSLPHRMPDNPALPPPEYCNDPDDRSGSLPLPVFPPVLPGRLPDREAERYVPHIDNPLHSAKDPLLLFP